MIRCFISHCAMPRGTAAIPVILIAMVLSLTSQPVNAQRDVRSRGGAGVYGMRIEPHWLEGDQGFWYRSDLPQGRRAYMLVDTQTGTRTRAFDHERLAAAMTKAGVADLDPERLMLDSLTFSPDRMTLEIALKGRRWSCRLSDYELSEPEAGQEKTESSAGPGRVPRASRSTGGETYLTFRNRLDRPVDLFWLDTEGQRVGYGRIVPGGEREQHTFAGHVWEAVAGDDVVGRFVATEQQTAAVIDGTNIPEFLPAGRRPGGGPQAGRQARQRRSEFPSPDGRQVARIRDDNIVLVDRESDAETPLTTDGTPDVPWGNVSWSPDSQYLTAFRITPGEDLEVHLIESSPEDGGRAVVHSRPYPLPGDRFSSHELHVFSLASAAEVPCEVEAFDFGTPRVRWKADGHLFTVEKTDRGHQRFRLIQIDAETGTVRNLIDEQTETFIWTAHAENLGIRHVQWLEQTDELIYVSERDGWRHLYLIDAMDGTVKNQITQGDWVVRGVDRVDEEQRQIWFRASGMDADQDPYLIHYCRVNFDGSGFTRLTAGHGNHSVQYSPGGEFLIGSYSRVDQAPQHELRRTSDGSLVCELEAADISELESRGWKPPEVFSAKGRDGKTDIWGIIVRPSDFDPSKKYPVIEDIYAGPQSAFVPKTFSPATRYRELTDLGFIVVKIDGMGTAHRSKAFHDVCWQNLRDAGFPDRIAWMKAAAALYPEMDLSRVGVYGTSAGGQNAAGAVLFHPEFYKAACASCGCHDNRMDKASWNEQWMGYPVGPHYAESSNIDNAWRLQGKLMLIVGEMDTNVPPESTLRFADALIKADKDFDLIVVPGMGHSNGGRYGQRRMQDFFVRHLKGEEPADHNGG